MAFNGIVGNGMFRTALYRNLGIEAASSDNWRRPATCNASAIMSKESQGQLTRIERTERALMLLAYFIELDGDAHLPLFEKFEAELEEFKRMEGTRDRARRLLAAYSRHGGVKQLTP